MLGFKKTSLLVTAVAIASLFVGLAGPASAAGADGIWLRPSTGTQVHFYNCGGKLCGKVVGVSDASRKEEIGKMILSGAKKTADNKWEGALTDVGSGKVYSGYISLDGPGALEVKGCVTSFLCQGETWTKVK